MTLMSSFTESSGPKAKRRKLDHGETQDAAPSAELDEGRADQGPDMDEVEEPEEATNGLEEQPDDADDSENEEDVTDPFEAHFAQPDDELTTQRIKAVKDGKWATSRALMQTWRATHSTPGDEATSDAPQPITGLDNLRLKQKLKETVSKKMATLSPVQQTLGSVLFNYRDVLHCDRTVSNAEQLRQLTCLHVLNHIFK